MDQSPLLGLQLKIVRIVFLILDTNIIYEKLSHYSKKHGHLKVYLKSELPKEWNFGNNDRIAPIIVTCEPTYQLYTRTKPVLPPIGSHGYPLPNNDMDAIFIAHGKLIRNRSQLVEPTSTLGSFTTVDLFPFVLSLLGIRPPKSNATNYLVDNLIIPN